jgi:hypothetical protein
MSITQRLERLEKLVSPPNDPLTQIISFVTADNGRPALVQPEVTHARTGSDNWRLNREPGELLDDFTKRATALAPRNEFGVAIIILDYESSAK